MIVGAGLAASMYVIIESRRFGDANRLELDFGDWDFEFVNRLPMPAVAFRGSC